MQPFTIFIFSSLVCLNLSAAPKGDSFEEDYEYEYSYEKNKDGQAQPSDLLDSTSLTQPSPRSARDFTLFEADRRAQPPPHSLSLYSIIMDESEAGIGLHTSWARSRDQYWQFDLLLNNQFKFKVGVNRTRQVRFSEVTYSLWKLGLINFVKESEKMASFINVDNYFARAGIGLHWRFSESQFAVEIEALGSLKLKKFGALLLISYGFF